MLLAMAMMSGLLLYSAAMSWRNRSGMSAMKTMMMATTIMPPSARLRSAT